MKSSTKDRVEGKLHEVKGSIKAAVGRTINNPNVAIGGKNEKIAGEIQETLGKVKKTVGK